MFAYVCHPECTACGSCLLSQFLLSMLNYVTTRECMFTLNTDFRVSNKSDHICQSHFRDNSINLTFFCVFAIVLPGCKLHSSDEQFAAGG